jgi:radical SAM superfamily enzyme YgiQ (UPF0313 family)
MNGDKILFTSVFGPYGIKNDYAEALGMQMELLNNQVTRCQGVHSPRQSYLTFALYLLAENISIPSTVLDFPTWKAFREELKKGYTHVAVSFIVPNVLKVKRMAEYIRKFYPRVKIILGGYGTIIPDLEKLVPHDEVCNGEGVRWIREYFGEDAAAPIVHPVLRNPVYNYTYGIRTRPRGSVLMTGVGCRNGCSFCITSHMFKKEYLPLLDTGRDVFNTCLRLEEKLGAANFMVMDENFLMKKDRGVELLALMEKEMKPWSFVLFCSANIVNQLGVDFFLRMGISRVWIGVESKTNTHDKVKGVDLKKLIAELQEHGIIVLASTILFQDHHDRDTINEEIEWVNSLNSDLVQFMNYTPWPTTGLYEKLESDGRLKNVPYRNQHGAGELLFDHPHFKNPLDHERYLFNAFRKKYRTGGPAIANMALTAVKGYIRALNDMEERLKNGLAWNCVTLCYEKCGEHHGDEYMELRIGIMKKEALRYRPVLYPAMIFSPNRSTRKKVYGTIRLYNETFGTPGFREIIKSVILVSGAALESLRILAAKIRGRESVIRQPATYRMEYNKSLK